MNDQNATDYREELIEKVKENYLSIALGFLVFLVAVTLIFRSTGSTTDEAADDTSDETAVMNTYVVKPGESVSSIARDQLGSMDYTDEIVALNNLENPNQLEVGQEIILPDVSEGSETEETTEGEAMQNEEATEAQEGEMSATSTDKITGDTYTVKKGDELFKIAERAYGDGKRYMEIVKANNLRNPDDIEVGMVLKIPRTNTK